MQRTRRSSGCPPFHIDPSSEPSNIRVMFYTLNILPVSSTRRASRPKASIESLGLCETLGIGKFDLTKVGNIQSVPVQGASGLISAERDVNLLDEPDLDDVHTVGSMLKAWLRHLPDELIPTATQARIARECASAKDSGEAPQMLKDELSSLPPFHYYLLFAITAHVALLYKFRDQNKMSYHNLCICFQPCLGIEPFIFHFLVEDWKNCWQGCWTEKEHLEEEYRILEGHTPHPLTTPSRTAASRDTTDSAATSSKRFNPAKLTSMSPELRSAGLSSRSPTSKDVTPPPTAPAEARSPGSDRPVTPPELAPVEPVSPMRM